MRHNYVAEAFLHGEPATSGAFVSVGDAIYSYALKLAHRDARGVVITDVNLDARAPSVTTARHINALRRALSW